MAKKPTRQAPTKATKGFSIPEVDPVEPVVYEKGSSRPFIITTPTTTLSAARTANTKLDYIFIGTLVVLGIFIRLSLLEAPDSVVFDEVHFGGFAKKYIQGTFFMDVHPPLAKMLFAGVGSFFGFKGDFDFAKIGDVYPASTPYFYMRAFPAVLGLGTVVLSYLTLRASGVRASVAFIAGLLFTWENSYVTISRYILLDSPLMFFIAAAAYGFKRFQNETPLSFHWYRALLSTGIALGLAVSSKWVGLFTIAWIGALNVWDMWFLIGDLTVPVPKLLKQTFARGSVLLGVPLVLYLSFFAIHFNLLWREGDGGPFMSSAFRTTLHGNKIPSNIAADVGVGSTISLRHVNTQGGYLHSHNHYYETGSKQQQITLYPHIDANNEWVVELYNVTEAPVSFEQITDGTKIRLKHKLTSRRLHSHDHKAPVSENDWSKEASCYGYEGFDGDANDDFIVEIQKEYTKDVNAQTNLRAIESVFRLRHAMSGCYLFSHEVKLPAWAFDQQEVICATQGIVPQSLWYIETNENPFLPADAERINYPTPSFLEKVVESHKKMWAINKKLDSPHNFQSTPDEWPLLSRGISYWSGEKRAIYLLGNAPVWWAVSVFIFGFVVYTGVQILRWQLGETVGDDAHVFNFNVQAIHYLLGWFLHYFPSWLMGRQMFLHHYLPAYYFGILALAHFLDIIVSYICRKNKIIGYSVILPFVALSLYFYANYSAIIYGSQWTKQECLNSRWISTWDYDCGRFPESYNDYSQSAGVVNEAEFFQSATTLKEAAATSIEELAKIPSQEAVIAAADERVVNLGEPAAGFVQPPQA
ncbi:hypothetical protein WICPIJ_008562 [Wickerhamomyces pijperi]|uniref:Dolichyl-phosphate-mannose--protein mannosyltransferase n=1 Tax=Wickerhamomyces pijperi TaxID=599730 RepID=A0A9P8TID3_WICPI|nr:hypothetical protein WICPIJ_008562 [Wickerhamomyces pijperi]